MQTERATDTSFDIDLIRGRLNAQTRALDVFDIVAETDRRGRITSVNDPFVQISKYTREELLGQDHRILNSGFHPKEFFKNIWTTINRGEIWSGEIRNRAKDGTIYWVSTVITPILDSSQNIRGFLSIRRDITKEKIAEEQLRESELRFRELLDNVNFVAVGLNLHGYITFTNRALCKLTGYQREELLGRDWVTHLIPEADRHRVVDIISKALTEQGQLEPVEFSMISKTGEIKLIAWTNAVFKNPTGHIIGLTALGEDITEKRASESKIAALRAQTDRRKEEVVGFVSHELRSPLMGINLSVDTIQEMLPSNHPAQSQLKIILEQISKIGKISKDLMQSVVYHPGELQFQFKPTAINPLLEHLARRFSDETRRRQIEIEFKALDSNPIGLWDPDRLDQVFSNLITNAIKYSKPSGGRIQIQLSQSEKNILVRVADEGMGIPPESLNSIFESFSRAENVKTEKVDGFGLGLKIAKDIVDCHRGRIWATSTLGQGSEFFVELPLSRPADR